MRNEYNEISKYIFLENINATNEKIYLNQVRAEISNNKKTNKVTDARREITKPNIKATIRYRR